MSQVELAECDPVPGVRLGVVRAPHAHPQNGCARAGLHILTWPFGGLGLGKVSRAAAASSPGRPARDRRTRRYSQPRPPTACSPAGPLHDPSLHYLPMMS